MCLNVLFLILFSHTFSAIFHPLLFLQPISIDWWIPNISHWITSLRLHSHLFSSSKRAIYLEIHQYISKYIHPLLFFSLSILSQLKMKPSFKKNYLFLAILSGMWDLSSPDQRSNPHLLHWKCGFLTTGPLGRSQRWNHLDSFLFFKHYSQYITKSCSTSHICLSCPPSCPAPRYVSYSVGLLQPPLKTFANIFIW